MKLIKPSFEIIEQPSGLEGMYKQIELVGRVTHKSEDRITENSAKEFVDKMIKLGHGAVLEHGTVYLYIDYHNPSFGKVIDRYINNKYSKFNIFPNFPNKAYISSNYRVLVENNWLNDLKYLCEPTEFHEKRVCVKFICDRGVSHEFVRHRHFSFMQESTRYCNYSNGKFDNELTFIIPCWLDIPDEVCGLNNVEYWEFRNSEPYGHIGILGDAISFHIQKETCRFLDVLRESERKYIQLIELGWNPQQARAVLPNALKTELYMTGFISDWKGFFELRSNKYGKGGAHPQADELATPLYEEFKKRNLI